MNQHLDLFAELAAPFEPEAVRVRPQGGRQLQYITARTVMNRLDEVLGPANWWDDYLPLEHSVICRLTIRLPDGTTLTKCDAGGYAGMPDQGDDDKSGFSDAFKRAAVKFGIGRYLYRDGVPSFVQERFRHPSMSADPSQPQGVPARSAAPQAGGSRPLLEGTGQPQTGKALFAWIKQQDEKQQDLGLLRHVSDWGQQHEFPARMVQWDYDQVQRAFDEACARLESTSTGKGEEAASAPGTQASEARPAVSNGSRPSNGVRKDREPSQPRAARSR
jgi:hypothetical protein